ncbi:MAG: VOC family protein [Solirubrobacterales bacterium]|nr:VOC family protein [Solirubrobacterales bacterium]
MPDTSHEKTATPAAGPRHRSPLGTVADDQLTPPHDPTLISGFLNIRVSDIAAVYRDWSSRGARFITEPLDNHGAELRCYLRDPDGYLIEVGQTLAGVEA